LISTLGDVLLSSVGLVSAVMSLPHRILLIDEPEAFLHPTLARRVGRVLSETARERDASLVVATHSAGIQAAPELRLVRLTYAGDRSTARSIEPAEIVTLMNDPLLRSSNALRALFHRGVVVTEADADRAFYEEVNYRLLQNGRGIEDGLFMNAQNWQTIPRIVGPLRRLGIPAAAIFDFDVLMDQDFQHIWPLLHAAQPELEGLQNNRADIKQLMETRGREACKALGVGAFDDGEKERIIEFINKMAEFGLFFVVVGELECWLAALGVPRIRNKAKWLTDLFVRLGSDPTGAEYVRAGEDDVWVFVQQIEGWVANSARVGIPG
jgi:hypothetical protein